MSNFTCEHCNTDILEGEDGRYITECEHWPIEQIKPLSIMAESSLWTEGKCKCPKCCKYRKRSDIPDNQPTSDTLEYKDMTIHIHTEPMCKFCRMT